MKLRIMALMILVICTSVLQAQMQTPIKWSYAAKKLNAKEAILYLKADLNKGWHIYSMLPSEGGPVSTSFKFVASEDYSLFGEVLEPKPIKKRDKSFDMNLFYFEKSVIFQQKIELTEVETVVKGKVVFMACNDKMCLPPNEVSFEIPVK